MTTPELTAPAIKILGLNITEGLATALADFQASVPVVERDRNVIVEHKDGTSHDYDYATLSNVTQKILPELGRRGLSFTALPGLGSDGKLALRYLLMHKSGGYIHAEFPLSGQGGIQVIGGAITYARRYCLQAVTGVAAEQDDDAATAQAAEQAAGQTAQRRRRDQARTEQAAANTARRRDKAADEPPPADRPTSGAPRQYSAPRNPEATVSGPQQQKLIMQFRDLGQHLPEGSEQPISRESRLRIVSGLMGRQIGSIKELNAGEAHELIEVIDGALATPDPVAAINEAIADVRAAQSAGAAQDGEREWAAELEQAKADAQEADR